jgi:predicted anti-sigma-YlaC factor YlaD
MNCPESHDLLQRRLDGRPGDGGAGLEGHLAECAACRDRHAATQRLAEGLRLLARPAPSEALAGRIVARLLAERRSRLRWRRRVLAAAALAAGLLVAALAGYQGPPFNLFQTTTPDPRAGSAERIPDGGDSSALVKNHRPETTEPSPPLDRTLEEAGEVALALTWRTAEATVARARQWLPPAAPFAVSLSPLGDADPLAPVLEPPTQSLRQAGHSVSAGLRPVTASARRAVDLFLREVPPMSSANGGL